MSLSHRWMIDPDRRGENYSIIVLVWGEGVEMIVLVIVVPPTHCPQCGAVVVVWGEGYHRNLPTSRSGSGGEVTLRVSSPHISRQQWWGGYYTHLPTTLPSGGGEGTANLPTPTAPSLEVLWVIMKPAAHTRSQLWWGGRPSARHMVGTRGSLRSRPRDHDHPQG